jgi:cell division transport system ATP-binding protein
MIEFCDVSLVYPNGVEALSNVSLKAAHGEFVFIVGPSGSGKSSLLKLIYRELLPTKGKVIVAGQDITKLPNKSVPYLRRRIGVVFQDFKLLPNKTVLENLAFVLRVTSVPKKEMGQRICEALKLVGILDRADSKPLELSGGEQQRASIARALVNNPPILIADEPTGNLDPETSLGIIQTLADINEERGTTVIVATHDNQVVDRLMRRVIALDCGRIVRDQESSTYHVTQPESLCQSELAQY